MAKTAITPVILSGGVGTRLWPLSRRALPKQLLALSGDATMLQQTLSRVSGEGFAAPIVICADEHRFLIAEQLREAGIAGARIVLEPAGRGTAPAAAIAALLVEAENPGGLVLLMPSDHLVADQQAFSAAVTVAARAAGAGALVTFGITPTAPETGYGYILAGEAMAEAEGAFRIAQFVEKPDRATAERYLATSTYSWNSGMFLFRADTFLSEMTRLEPASLDACRSSLAGGRKDLDFIRLEEGSFLACTSQSIDYAVMERTEKAAMVPVSMGWSDVGSWQSLWEIAPRTADGNIELGDVLAEDVRNSYLRSEGPLLAAMGVEDLVVVATRDAVLVSRRDRSQDVKRIVERLESASRDLHLVHPVSYRPWGSFEVIASGSGFQVKRLVVRPGQKLSLQMHHHRAEHWVVVEGAAQVTCGERVVLLYAGQSIFIPKGSKHRLENSGEAPLHVIEVQSGGYLGEDDIVRFEDNYGRIPSG